MARAAGCIMRHRSSVRHRNCSRQYAGREAARMGNDSKGPVTVRIPVRIDFAGGWSDVHYFSEREGGAVLNAAISPYVEGSARWEGWQLHLEYSLALPYNAARRRKAVRAR